jgi:hypothetical protein
MASGTSDLEEWREPPIHRLLSGAQLLSGDHQHNVWQGITHRDQGTGVGILTVMKQLPSSIAIAMELACAMAGQVLRLPVPMGALVIADRDQLMGLPKRAAHESRQIICFGSYLKWPDETMRRILQGDAAIEEWTWSQLCNSNHGSPGAAWDELVANDDRHYQNIVFSGEDSWWLIDHESSLEPIAKVYRRWAEQTVRDQLREFEAKSNTLASEMMRRRPKDHAIDRQPASLRGHRERLSQMADQVRNWDSSNEQLRGIFSIVEIVLRSIHGRLPALEQHLRQRLDDKQQRLTWDFSNPPQ